MYHTIHCPEQMIREAVGSRKHVGKCNCIIIFNTSNYSLLLCVTIGSFWFTVKNHHVWVCYDCTLHRLTDCVPQYVWRILWRLPTLWNWTVWPCTHLLSNTLGLQVRVKTSLPLITCCFYLSDWATFFLIGKVYLKKVGKSWVQRREKHQFGKKKKV